MDVYSSYPLIPHINPILNQLDGIALTAQAPPQRSVRSWWPPIEPAALPNAEASDRGQELVCHNGLLWGYEGNMYY